MSSKRNDIVRENILETLLDEGYPQEVAEEMAQAMEIQEAPTPTLHDYSEMARRAV